ncbi:SWIM-type domain-containing protein [Trichonephila clavipes]|nr:SWIM-type domain-containing protein [Trichonephila clavipes]
MLEEFILQLQHAGELEFANYFNKYYFDHCEKWAYCYRKGLGINTNMSLEILHRTIKHNYLERKKIKRRDRSIHALQNFINDKQFETVIYLLKGKVSSNQAILRNRHNISKTMELDVFEEDDIWLVKSSTVVGEFYSVTEKFKCVWSWQRNLPESSVWSEDRHLDKHKQLQRMLLEWQEVSLHGCGIYSKKQGMFNVSQDKVVHVLPQKIMTDISCNNSSIQNNQCSADSKRISFGNRSKGLNLNNPKKASCRWSVCIFRTPRLRKNFLEDETMPRMKISPDLNLIEHV